MSTLYLCCCKYLTQRGLENAYSRPPFDFTVPKEALCVAVDRHAERLGCEVWAS